MIQTFEINRKSQHGTTMKHPHELTVHGADGSGWYTFLLAKGGEWQATDNTEHPDRIEQNGRRASGKVVNGGEDTFRFGGIIVDANFDENIGSVEINGKRYAPETVVEEWRKDAGVTDSSSSGGGGDSSPPSPDDPPADNGFEFPDLPPASKETSYGGGLWIPTGEENRQRGMVGRYHKSEADETIHVDADESGGAQNAGNLLPREIEHDVEVVFGPGDHTGNGSSLRLGKTYVHSNGTLTLRGQGAAKTRVTGLNAVFEGKQYNIQLRDIHFTSLSQVVGPVDARRCKFEGFDKAGRNSSGTAAISGKNGRWHMKECVIGSKTDDYSLWPTIMEQYVCLDCTFVAREAAINESFGSDVKTWGCDFSQAPKERT